MTRLSLLQRVLQQLVIWSMRAPGLPKDTLGMGFAPFANSTNSAQEDPWKRNPKCNMTMGE
ncbi:hypothetical protein ACSSV1_005982 [Labrenzia sp. MBR-25]|jgi:hypothetical protein